ncbi:MAG: hypothetical protein JNM17_11225 [Archangium sp.]|nr:hypothetical protein [Archangium sp.]
MQRNKHLWIALLTGALIAAGAFANVNYPFTFQANTPARASEVNANFTAVKTVVDDHETKLAALTCPQGMTRLGGICVEPMPARGPSNFFSAANACGLAGRRLCPVSLYASHCAALGVPNLTVTSEWTGEVASNTTGSLLPVSVTDISSSLLRCGFNTAGGVASDSTVTMPFRCCL